MNVNNNHSYINVQIVLLLSVFRSLHEYLHKKPLSQAFQLKMCYGFQTLHYQVFQNIFYLTVASYFSVKSCLKHLSVLRCKRSFRLQLQKKD
jgi:hypothetical protein